MEQFGGNAVPQAAKNSVVGRQDTMQPAVRFRGLRCTSPVQYCRQRGTAGSAGNRSIFGAVSQRGVA